MVRNLLFSGGDRRLAPDQVDLVICCQSKMLHAARKPHINALCNGLLTGKAHLLLLGRFKFVQCRLIDRLWIRFCRRLIHAAVIG